MSTSKTSSIAIIAIETGERTATATIGDVVLHFNPATGKQVRQVRIVKITTEDVAYVEVAAGRNKGESYPLAANLMAA